MEIEDLNLVMQGLAESSGDMLRGKKALTSSFRSHLPKVVQVNCFSRH